MHPHIRNSGEFRVLSKPNMHFLVMLEEAVTPVENLHKREVTPQRKSRFEFQTSEL